jgi:hypothetical protein
MKPNASKIAILLTVAFVYSLSMLSQVIVAPTLRSNGKIAFTSNRDGDSESYLVNPNGKPDKAHPNWKPLIVSAANIEELYAAVNNANNAEAQILIAPGVYALSVNAPTKWHAGGEEYETVSRLCFISPDTTEKDIADIIASMN